MGAREREGAVWLNDVGSRWGGGSRDAAARSSTRIHTGREPVRRNTGGMSRNDVVISVRIARCLYSRDAAASLLYCSVLLRCGEKREEPTPATSPLTPLHRANAVPPRISKVGDPEVKHCIYHILHPAMRSNLFATSRTATERALAALPSPFQIPHPRRPNKHIPRPIVPHHRPLRFHQPPFSPHQYFR